MYFASIKVAGHVDPEYKGGELAGWYGKPVLTIDLSVTFECPNCKSRASESFKHFVPASDPQFFRPGIGKKSMEVYRNRVCRKCGIGSCVPELTRQERLLERKVSVIWIRRQFSRAGVQLPETSPAQPVEATA